MAVTEQKDDGVGKLYLYKRNKMNVVFLTMSRIDGVSRRGIYTDLMRMFRDEGHQVYIVSPNERSFGNPTELLKVDGLYVLGVKTLNLQKTSVIEKGLGQVLVEKQYKVAIKKHLSDVKFDLILYSTPPITFPKVISFLKNNNPQAKTYLLLKDIFPQNAVDIGMMSTTGLKGVLYRFFRKKEKKLYDLSDFIGCMSPANVEYVLKHNPEIAHDRVEVAPNSVELVNADDSNLTEKSIIREKYGIPVDKPVFIYGGNLGKPQGIDFLVKCLEANNGRKDCHFVIVGAGTDQHKIQTWYDTTKPENTTLLKALPKIDYDTLVQACDIGLIFLDHRFTIPNYPSRLLSYLENKMPVLCATDPNCDMGSIAEANGFGYWCESLNPEDFTALVDKMLASDRKAMGEKGYEFLCNNYLVENTYKVIMSHV